MPSLHLKRILVHWHRGRKISKLSSIMINGLLRKSLCIFYFLTRLSRFDFLKRIKMFEDWFFKGKSLIIKVIQYSLEIHVNTVLKCLLVLGDFPSIIFEISILQWNTLGLEINIFTLEIGAQSYKSCTTWIECLKTLICLSNRCFNMRKYLCNYK